MFFPHFFDFCTKKDNDNGKTDISYKKKLYRELRIKRNKKL